MSRKARENCILGSIANVGGVATSEGHHSLSHPMPFFSGKMAECDVSLELIGVVSFLSDPNPLLCKVEVLIVISSFQHELQLRRTSASAGK